MFQAFEANKLFDEIITDNTKNGYKFKTELYAKNGEISIIDQGTNFISGYIDKQPEKEPWNKECIIFGDHTEIFKYINFPIYLGADGTKLLSVKNNCNTLFVYYYLSIYYKKIGGYSRHFKFLKELRIPTPPIELQNKFAEFVQHIDKLKFICKKITFLIKIWYNETKNMLNTHKRNEKYVKF